MLGRRGAGVLKKFQRNDKISLARLPSMDRNLRLAQSAVNAHIRVWVTGARLGTVA
jgi:hypothetical protein